MVGCLKIKSESLRLNFSLTMEEESTWTRWYASFFSESFRNRAVAAQPGR